MIINFLIACRTFITSVCRAIFEASFSFDLLVLACGCAATMAAPFFHAMDGVILGVDYLRFRFLRKLIHNLLMLVWICEAGYMFLKGIFEFINHFPRFGQPGTMKPMWYLLLYLLFATLPFGVYLIFRAIAMGLFRKMHYQTERKIVYENPVFLACMEKWKTGRYLSACVSIRGVVFLKTPFDRKTAGPGVIELKTPVNSKSEAKKVVREEAAREMALYCPEDKHFAFASSHVEANDTILYADHGYGDMTELSVLQLTNWLASELNETAYVAERTINLSYTSVSGPTGAIIQDNGVVTPTGSSSKTYSYSEEFVIYGIVYKDTSGQTEDLKQW